MSNGERVFVTAVRKYCASHGIEVELKADGSGLRCVSCHRLYPIRDEIPVMLIDEASIDE